MTTSAIKAVLCDVADERDRQRIRWGDQDHDALTWLAILGEEFGEVAKECAEGTVDRMNVENYREELIHVAAVACAAVESLDRWRHGDAD